MSEERKKVLEMLAAGKITSEEAERLLDRLEARADDEQSAGAAGARPRKPGSIPKYLRVEVDSIDGDKVNVRVPLELIRAGIKLSTVLPVEASVKMREKGIDVGQLSELHGDELLKALEELTVNVDSSNGDKVRVFCE